MSIVSVILLITSYTNDFNIILLRIDAIYVELYKPILFLNFCMKKLIIQWILHHSTYFTYIKWLLTTFEHVFHFFLTESQAMGSLNGGRGTLDNFGTWKTNIVFAALPISILFCIVAISSQRGTVSRGFVFSFPSSCKSCFANAELIHKSAA